MKAGSPLFLRTIALVKMIPKGRVLSYGGVAELITAPGCARHVSYILSSSSRKYRLPWHRVVNSAGGISNHSCSGRQKSLLKTEGVIFDGSRIDLDEFAWKPTKREVQKILKGLPKHVTGGG